MDNNTKQKGNKGVNENGSKILRNKYSVKHNRIESACYIKPKYPIELSEVNIEGILQRNEKIKDNNCLDDVKACNDCVIF